MDVMMENDVILFLGEKGGRFMKKFISLLVAAALCAGSSVAVFGADIPEGWHAVSDEELGLPSEEEERAITAALRNGGKEITDDEYAALYAPERRDIDCLPDMDIAGKYLGEDGMNYNVETYINPTFTNIHRLYYCTQVLMYTGHGYHDRVIIVPDNADEDQRTGVYMGDTNLTDDGYEAVLVGLGNKDMSDCRFALFACCLAASDEEGEGNNIANYVTKNGAETSVGWKVRIGSQDLQEWEETFFNSLDRGLTVEDAVDMANSNSNAYIKPAEIRNNEIYGNKYQKLSENLSKSSTETYEEKLRKIMEEYGFMWVDEELDINCANGDVDELTEYFANNIEGFDPEKFEITLINNYADGANLYNILYQLIINGFETPYSISVSVEDDKEISYRVFFDEKDIEKLKSTPLKFTEYGFEEEIEKAKKEAAKAVPDDAVMEGQEVTKKLDENLKPYLYIETSCKDEYGGVFLLTYKCDLDADDIEG